MKWRPNAEIKAANFMPVEPLIRNNTIWQGFREPKFRDIYSRKLFWYAWWEVNYFISIQ